MLKGLEKHVELTQQIIAACYEVHKILGPGLEERFYRDAFMHELELRGLKVQRKQEFVVEYKGKQLGNCSALMSFRGRRPRNPYRTASTSEISPFGRNDMAEQLQKIPKSRPLNLEKTMTILDDIIKYKQNEELPKQMQARESAVVRAEAALAPKPRDFVAALRATKRVALIGEIKKASPSKGLLRHHFDPVELAQTYAANGAAAISVLTDAKYFQGKLEYLTQIRQHLKATGDRGRKTADRRPIRQAQGKPQIGSSRPRLPASSPPLLRKDFVFHPYQVYEARAAGADALLLIAAVLKDKELADLLKVTHELGLTALIEVHDRAELERVLLLQPRLIGVNNRDLRDFSVDLNLCIELRQHVPADICFVAESGIHTAADVARLAKEGIDAILVGEALMKSKDVGAKVRELINYEL